MMRLIQMFFLLLCLGWALPLQAQDDLTPYEIALQHIEEARISGETELSLGWLDLRELPPEIGQLNNLEYLYVGRGNRLENLPPEIGNLINLRELYLAENQLTSLPSELWQLSNLERLSLGSNPLRVLPSEIGQLRNLKYLYLGHSQLTSLPPELWQLNKLESLLLGGNQLHTLPSEIGQLTNLESLWIDDNQLSSLPPEIGQLSNLYSLDVSDNNLSYLPDVLGDLKYLTESNIGLEVNGNPLISPPEEVIAQGTPTILKYLRNPTWWHIKRMIVYVGSAVVVLTLIVLGLRWRYTGIFSFPNTLTYLKIGLKKTIG